MSNLRFNDVRVMLADSRTHIRNTLKTALSHAGLENIEHAARLDQVAEALDQGLGPDILICDIGLDGGDACEIIDDIRHNEVGRNPFMCILGITWNPTELEVERVINSGIDLLVAAPMSPKQILDRVESLVRNRLPWAITGDYIGPDRRKGSDRAQNLPLVSVPNTLKEKALGTYDASRVRSDIAHAVNDLAARKIERQAVTITELADLIVSQSSLTGPTMVKSHIDRLFGLVTDLDRRAAKRGFTHISELCAASVTVVRKMRNADTPPLDKDVQLLKHLALAIRTAMTPAGGAELIAHDIAQTVIGAGG
jgi:DNA-binding response OmpR family regulator